MLQQPARTTLTALGTFLGVGAFVAVLGLTSTASGQIDERFTALAATEVLAGAAEPDSTDGQVAPLTDIFPPDADDRAGSLVGVVNAGVWWSMPDLRVTGIQLPGEAPRESREVRAASPGLLRALRPSLDQGRLYDSFHSGRADRVVVLGAAAAAQLGITDLAFQPAVFVDEIPFVVIGVIADVERFPEFLSSVMVPTATSDLLWEGHDRTSPTMVIDTELGAAQVVASQVALALRPDAPELLHVVPPLEPSRLRDSVASDLSLLFLVLAGVSLVIGAVGIANTTMVAVLERIPEIGLRRALGARGHHIAAQFLTESAAIGALGGVAGTGLGLIVVLAVSIWRDWTPLVEPWSLVAAPLSGVLVGVLAGAYPSLRAARVDPIEALRR